MSALSDQCRAKAVEVTKGNEKAARALLLWQAGDELDRRDQRIAILERELARLQADQFDPNPRARRAE